MTLFRHRTPVVPALLAGLVLLVLGLPAGPGASTASADTAPPAGTPATVSADVLPTVQINGVVWAQVTVGTTVYATGSFTSARPAGSAAGVNETPRSNLLAYDIRTGALLTGFAHSLNAQGRAITASPDGTRVYVGGDFTTVDGVAHNHIAAFDTASGALVGSFAPSYSNQVLALAATNSTVYAGGTFFSVNGVARTRLAASAATSGALLSWAPKADDNNVSAMTLTPARDEVVVGGKFTTVSGTAAYGLAALDPTTGALLPFAAGAVVRNAGTDAGITSLKTDGRYVLGTGYVFGAGGNLEGAFAADPANGGALVWMEDCHGDSYDTYANGQVAYVVSHEHACNTLGFPQTNPLTFHRATAFTDYATGTLGHNPIGGYADFGGQPAPTPLTWYPTLSVGSYTRQNQAAWSATGAGGYIALGGEFPSVNGTPQQGLVRFAVPTTAPDRVGPLASAALTPAAVSQSPGTVRVAWTATSDPDNASLTYALVRDGQTATPVSTQTVSAPFWKLPRMGFTDTGLVPGSTHTYRVVVTDPNGNVRTSSSSSATVSATAPTAYTRRVLADGATSFWRLGEPSGTTGYDRAGYDDLTLGTGTTRGAAGAIGGDADTATTFDGTANGTAASSTPIDAPTTFSVESWVRTTSTSGGKIVGFGGSATGASSTYDRHLYLDDAGHLVFGVYGGGTHTVTTPGTYNDGAWHQVVGTLSASGMALFVDGRRVGGNGTTTADPYPGFWRVGGDDLDGWPSQPTSRYLAGDIDDVAVYPTALTLAQVAAHYTASGRDAGLPPAPTDRYGTAVTADSPSLFWRLDDAAGSAVAADSSGNDERGGYSGGTTEQAASPVTGTSGTGATLDGTDGLISSADAVADPTTFSEELWFSTTSRSGGKLIGFGSSQTGLSDHYDRHVWMTDAGELVFGTYTGQLNTVTSAPGLDDGAWHHVVATLGAAGMALYVDGARVGTNPATGAEDYSGYWRVGGDRTWYGADSSYLAATVDEVAVYPTALSADRVLAHYRASALAPAPTSPTTPTAPANQAPTASFTATPTGLTVAYDGSASADPDGTVTTWSWDFGDGTTATGTRPSHTYTAAGTYPTTLTVTDDGGATGTTTRTVTVAPPADPNAAYTARDTFARTVANGLGTADKGGAWTVVGTTSRYAVSANAASLATAPGGQPSAYLPGVSSTDTDTTLGLTTDRAADQAVYVSVVGRRVATNTEYRGRVRILPNNTVTVSFGRLAGSSTETVLGKEVTVPGLTFAPGTPFRVRLQVTGTGTTTLRIRAWAAGSAEPTTWLSTVTDATASLQAAGSVGVTTYLSSAATTGTTAVKVSDYAVGPTA